MESMQAEILLVVPFSLSSNARHGATVVPKFTLNSRNAGMQVLPVIYLPT